jgi:Creatinase/Prolidase N-terminal domain.
MASEPLSFSLPPVEVAERYKHLTESLYSTGLVGLVITNMANIRYLSGFSGSTAVMVCPNSFESSGLLITDGRYKTQAETELREHGSEVDIFIGNATEQREALCKKVST